MSAKIWGIRATKAAVPLLAVLFGYAASRGSSSLAVLLAAPLLGVAALWAATAYSRQFMIGAILVLTLVPIVGAPEHRILHPAILGLAVIAFTGGFGLLPRRRLSITLIDVGVLVALSGCVLSVLAGHETRTKLEVVLFLWFCPYFAARSLTGSGQRTTLLKAFALAGAIAIPFGLIEVAFGNLFLKVFPFGSEPQFGLGAHPRRLGIYRAEGALGQPIPYAMFLSIAAVAAITLWAIREDRRNNRWLYLGVGMIAVQATTLTRTGWLMLTVVAILVLALNFRTVANYGNKRLLVFAMIGLAAVVAVPQTNKLIFGSTGSESVKLQDSAEYRSLLIKRALKPGYIDPLGTRAPQIGPHGSKSIDDEYVNAAWTWGYLPILGLVLILVAFLHGVWRHRRDVTTLAVYATCVATMVAIESVAFITQQEVLIWLLWGCASGLATRPARQKLKLLPLSMPLQPRETRSPVTSPSTHPANA